MGSTLAAAAMSAFALGAGASDTPAQANVAPQERLGLLRRYDLAPARLADNLNAFADANRLQIVYDANVTGGLRSRGLIGNYTVREALDRLLEGSGLSYRLSEQRATISIRLAQADNGVRSDVSDAERLPPIDVGAASGETRDGRRGGAPQGPGDRHTGYNAVSAPTTLKTDTPLLKTPLTVEVVTRQTMDDQQAISVGDALLTNVSGVTESTNVLDVFKIRGFSNPIGNIFKNGLMEYRIRKLDTTNLQTVEVLKGPASLLFGRGEPGGIVNLVVKRPLDTPYYSIQQQVKSFSGTRTTIDATGPLTQDKSILYRVNAEYYSNGSYRDYVSDRNLFIAPTLTFQPIEQFRMNIDFEYQNRTWVDDYPVLPAVGGSPASIPVSRYLSSASLMTAYPDHSDRKRIAYDWTYEFLPGWSLTNRLSYTSIATRNENVVPLSFNQTTGVLGRFAFFIPGTTDRTFATNLDLKGKFSTGPIDHSILVGLDAFKNYIPLYVSYQPFLSSINIYDPRSWQVENPYGNQVFGKSAQKWTGVYGQDMISLLDDTVHILLGGRYDWAESSANKNFSSYLNALSSYVTTYNTAFSPRVGAVYQPLPWLSFYGSYARSFGVSNSSSTGLPLDPQRGELYEAGVKAELLDRRLSLTMAYFDIFKTNMPYADPTNARNTLLIGKARSQGFEFDLTGRIDDNWSVIANYTHDDVRTVQGALSYNPATLITTQLAISGSKLPASPRNYGNLWVKYDADGELQGLSLGAGVSVHESSFGDNANSYVLPAYALVNGMIAYRTNIEGYTVTGQLNVKNLGDVTYYPTSTDRYTIQTGTPRTFVGSLRVEF
ncbi:TonB-dependent receptor [Methylosinus sp. Sm6]|uniref:TonB-dependent siderophore receptor n=1 Tax=Methylosinus sp. Sm6 TaxID=2866948 RepID=UPI001C99DB75|nr:TonB-dependent receptor [Methylosinus sp. Sm6]MBY6243805.1 TonB-dependent receptor [Methylosinus sp. Sm6]